MILEVKWLTTNRASKNRIADQIREPDGKSGSDARIVYPNSDNFEPGYSDLNFIDYLQHIYTLLTLLLE